jgi:hypothetical protein
MTRGEHLVWCKTRALEYLDAGDVTNAMASMLSDLDKHPETKFQPGSILVMLGLQAAINNDDAAARRFIVGFN